MADARTIPTTSVDKRATTARERLAGLSPQIPIEVIGQGGAEGLRTPRFHLRALCEDDRAEFTRVLVLSRQHLDQFSILHLPEESDDQLFERQLGLTQRGEASGLSLRRIAMSAKGQLVGAFNLNSISRGLAWGADLNWWVSAEHLNKGVATECVSGIVTHALRDLPTGLGLHEVRAYVQRDNAYSIKLAKKLGFAKQGDERTHLQMGDKWQLHDLYVRRVS